MSFFCSCSDNENGFATSYWGPCLWYVLKFFCLPSKSGQLRSGYLEFFEACGFLMPCSSCRSHFQCIHEPQPKLNTVKERIAYLNRMHNLVSLKVENRVIPELSEPQFVKLYSNAETASFAFKFFLTAVLMNSAARRKDSTPEEYSAKTQIVCSFVNSEFEEKLQVLPQNCQSSSFEIFRAKRDMDHCFMSLEKSFSDLEILSD